MSPRRFCVRGIVWLASAGFAAGALGTAWVRCVPYPVAQLDPGAGGPLVIDAADGRPLRSVPSGDGRPGRAGWVGLHAVAPAAVLTLLASEDQRFFEHAGVDPVGIGRAVGLDLAAGSLRYGGSTLTMQLMRMVHSAGRPRTLWNKLRECLLALSAERALGKREILEQYLNRAYYGHGAYGIEAAAQRYFGKPAAALSVGEATWLSVLPRGPGYYDPVRHPGRAEKRQAHLVSLLVAQGRLSTEQAARALSQPVRFELHEPVFEAPHFVDWVLRELPAELREHGGRVRTTLDLDLQRALEHRVAEHVAELAPRDVGQAGVVVLDSQHGHVLAMVGSRGYHAGPDGQLNIAGWRRHPGSALKPFVYATAMERGDGPGSVAYDVADVPSRYRMHGVQPLERGPVRYREALAGSYNLAAVHVLERVGVGTVMNKLARAGVGELPGSAADYGLRLALGSTRVRLTDLAAGYGFLVRQGRATRANAVSAIWRHDGVRLQLPHVPDVQVYTPEAAWLTMDMLADPVARRPMFGQELPADLPYPVAVKTGTARGFADAVAVFVTRELTVAAWTGRFDGGATQGVLGMEGAGPLARAALLTASRGARLRLPPPPSGLASAEVCALSGMRPGHDCPNRKHEHFIAGSEPTQTCSWHLRDRNGQLQVRYPDALKPWARRHHRLASR